jgi:hypothetical protein
MKYLFLFTNACKYLHHVLWASIIVTNYIFKKIIKPFVCLNFSTLHLVEHSSEKWKGQMKLKIE